MEILIKRESEPVRIKRVGPQAGGQERFLSATEYEVLFGGVAGPGKTWALVYDSAGFQFAAKLGKPAICFGDYRAVIFRRKTTELVKIIDEGRKLFCRAPLDAEYTQQRRGEPGPSFTFPAGAQIFCCHLQHEEDKFNHHGHEYQYIGFDELPTFTLTQYLYMFHRCRSTIVGLWPRIRATANPVGPGLMWVKKRFIRNGDFRMVPERPYWFVPDMSISDPMQNPMGIEAGPWVKEAKSRIYIPGKLEENQYIQDQDGYKASILQMGRKYAAALLDSDWEAFSGDFFEDFTDDLRVRPFEIPVGWPLFGSLDPGFTSPCSFGLQTVDPNGGIWRLMTYYLSGQSISEHVRNIWDRCRGFMFTAGRMPEYVVCGQDAFPPEGKKGTGDRVYFADVMRDQGLFCKRAVTARVQGWWAWKDAMRRKKWHYFDGYNQAMVEEMVSAQHDEEDPEDIIGHGNDQSVPDHCLDGDTVVITAGGRKKLRDMIGSEGWVLTSDNKFTRYSNCRLTRRNQKTIKLTFSDGSFLICTSDHKIMTSTREMICADATKDLYCSVSSFNHINLIKALISWRLKGFQKRFKNLGCVITNAVTIFRGTVTDCIGQFGNILTARFPIPTMSITKTKTDQTTISRISNWYPKAFTYPITCGNSRSGITTTGKTLTGSGTKQKSGMAAKPVLTGTPNMQKQPGRNVRPLTGNANAAGLFTRPREWVNQGFAQTPAKQNTTVGKIKIVDIEDAGIRDVYCLAAEDTHVFAIANGVIVSNCLDEARYAVLATYRPQKPQAVDPFAGRPQWGFERYSSYRNGDPRIIWGPNE